MDIATLMACSCRWRGWDKTVLSCRVGGVNTTADKTVLSCLQLCSHRRRGLIESSKLGWDETKLCHLAELAVWTQLETRQNSLVLSAVVFTPPTRTHWKIETGSRRDKTVLSVVWTQLETRQNCLVLSHRQCEQTITDSQLESRKVMYGGILWSETSTFVALIHQQDGGRQGCYL